MNVYKYLLETKLGLKYNRHGSFDIWELSCPAKNLNFGYFEKHTYRDLFKTLTRSETNRYIICLQPFVRILKMFPAELSSKTEVDVLWVLNGLESQV